MPRALRRLIVVIVILALVLVIAIPTGIYTWHKVDDKDVKALVQDTDNDGITDALDDCDDKEGPISNSGCPEGQSTTDTDSDGILDSVDNCDNDSGPASNNGCPTSGTPDSALSGDSVDPCVNVTVPTGYHCENGNVLKDASAETEITPEPTVAAQLDYYCTVQDKQRALSIGSGRIYEDDALLADLKAFGGTCHVDFGNTPVSFVYRSVEGVIKIDGNTVTNGNDKAATGKVFEVVYAANDMSNGFDLKF